MLSTSDVLELSWRLPYAYKYTNELDPELIVTAAFSVTALSDNNQIELLLPPVKVVAPPIFTAELPTRFMVEPPAVVKVLEPFRFIASSALKFEVPFVVVALNV